MIIAILTIGILFIVFRNRLFKKTCTHNWLINGWSTVKCEHCGKTNSNAKIIEETIMKRFPENERRGVQWRINQFK